MPGWGLIPQSLYPCANRPSRGVRTRSGRRLHRGQGTHPGAEAPVARAAGVTPHPALSDAGRSSAAVLVAAGLVAMAIGLLVYLADRDASHAALIPAVAAISGRNLFGAVGQWVPGFVHPFAFSLFTAATYPSRSSAGYLACIAWWAVNIAFEVAQYPGIDRSVAEAAERVFGASWSERLLSGYVLRGTFDVGDLIAATGGAVAAAAVLYFVHRLEVNHER